MSLIGQRTDPSKLAPWVGVVLTAAVAGGTVLAASNYRTGADQVTIENDTRQIQQLQADARADHDTETKAVIQIEVASNAAKEAKDAALDARASAQKIDAQVGLLKATVDDLKDAVNRLTSKVEGYPFPPSRSPSP